MCTVHGLTESTVLERSTKIMQLKTKCRNWVTRIMPQWTHGNKCSHTVYTVLHSEACVPDHVQKPDAQCQTFSKPY